MATPDNSPLSSANKAILARVFSHPTNSNIARISKILSTSAGVDSTLLLVGYSSILVSDQLNKLLASNIQGFTDKLGASGSAVLPLANQERISNARDAAKILAGSCSDVRAFMRLWGLLRMWGLARATYFDPPKDTAIQWLTWMKLAGISGYYALEHGFYLGGKGFYKGWKPEDIAKWFRMGIYSYAFYLLCDYLSLWRTAQLQEQTTEKVDPAKKAVEDRQWWKTLQVDAAYTPLCFHWATPGGLLSDSWVGFLGALAGIASVREAWIQAA